jgi:hypothetical protein
LPYEAIQTCEIVMWRHRKAQNLTFGELRRVVAVTRVTPCVLSYTGGFHSGSTAIHKNVMWIKRKPVMEVNSRASTIPDIKKKGKIIPIVYEPMYYHLHSKSSNSGTGKTCMCQNKSSGKAESLLNSLEV